MKRSAWSNAKKLLTLGLVALLAGSTLTACGAKERFMFGTGGSSGTYYTYGGTLASVMKDYSGIKVTAVATGASKVNIESIAEKDFQMGFAQSDVMTYAWNG